MPFWKRTPASTTAAPATTTPVTATTTSERWNPFVRHYGLILSILFILGVIELGLTADIVDFMTDNDDLILSDARANFKYALFVSVWTVVLTMCFLIGALLHRLRPMHHTIFLSITFLFWLIAAALIEDEVGDWNDDSICRFIIGRNNCHELKAARAFAWLLFIFSLFSVIASGWIYWHERRVGAVRHVDNSGTPMTTTTTAPAATTKSTAVV